MKFYLLILIGLIGPIFHSIAQSEWQDQRDLYKISEEEKAYPLYLLYKSIHYDYKLDENDQFVCDITFHEIARVGNDKALENRNQIYISMYNTVDLIDVKARAIAPDGKVTMLDQNNIKEIEDEDTDGYKIFAVEGAAVGGEIEYRYVKRVQASVFKNETIQFLAPVKKLEFSLKCPSFLQYDFRTVNDDTEVSSVDKSKEYNYYQAEFDNIPAYVNEGFSAGTPNKKRIDFKLAYNTNAGSRRLNTFSVAGATVYQQVATLSKDEQKAVKSFIQKNGLKSGSAIEKLKKLEDVIKKQFYVEEYGSPDLVEFFKNGYGSTRAFVKLFNAILETLEIRHELVVTGDRFKLKFSKDFDSWNYLSDYLFYLPEVKQYFTPHDMLYRYGSVPPEQTAMDGIYVKMEQITDYEFPVTRIDYIPEEPYQKNMNNLDIEVSFDEDLINTAVDATRTYTGLESSIYKYALSRINEDQKQEMLKSLVEYLAIDAEIDKVKIVEGDLSYGNWEKPFVVNTTFSTESYLEQAGNSLLFKVGDLIGAQSELYQEDERVYEIENQNNRGYVRKILVNIPDGYKVQNADDIKIKKEVKKGDRVIYLFDSNFEIKDNQLSILIDEYYDEIYYPANKFEGFRKVINAAADFNKVTLILKPE
ncbi:MAG: DUF3857 domain-containing protein [Bacteroidota bacterium]